MSVLASISREPLIARLRLDTCQLHAQLERQPFFADLMQGSMTQPQYLTFLTAYAGHLLPVASVLDQGLSPSAFHDFIAKACRLDALAKDLTSLGQPWPPARQCPVDWLEANSTSFLVGLLYVHLGSRLGARLISKRMQLCYGLNAGNGAAFFAAANDGAVWAGFLNLLSAKEMQLEVQATLRGAQAGFRELDSWLDRAAGGPLSPC